jgi:hypothetical protein
MYKEYNLPLDLYGKIQQSLTINYGLEDQGDLYKFVEELPHNLKVQASIYLHEETYKKMLFL